MKPESKAPSTCEVCQGNNLESVLDLGMHPMCDDLVKIGDDRKCVEYPIEILYCSKCRTAHQKYQVPKRELFPPSYHYRSRFTADVLNGMRNLVGRCEDLFGNLASLKVLDVGCNDGSLLSFFREKNAITIGIEPTGASEDAREQGHITYNEYLSPELAERIVSEHGHPDLIVFTNVFAHIEDLGAVLESLRRLLSPATSIVIENHYLGSVLEGNQFDTFYHEHPRTYSYTSFLHIADALGLALTDVDFPSRYGGNIRVFLGASKRADSRSGQSESKALLEREAAFDQKFAALGRSIEVWRRGKRSLLEALVKEHGKMAEKAFPGRAAILVKLLGLDSDLICSVYERPGSMKIGHYLPGTRIPILSDEQLFSQVEKSQPLLNFAWHISGEIRDYLGKHGYRGSVIDIITQKDFS